MNFEQIHTMVPRGSQAVLTGSMGMLTVRSSQKGSQSLSGILQSRFRLPKRQQAHQLASLTSRARMENRSSNIAIADPQSTLRALAEPFRCQRTLKHLGAAPEPLRALWGVFDRTSTFGQSLISGGRTDRVLHRRICQDQPIPALSRGPERFLTASECQHTPKRSERLTGHVMSLDIHLTI